MKEIKDGDPVIHVQLSITGEIKSIAKKTAQFYKNGNFVAVDSYGGKSSQYDRFGTSVGSTYNRTSYVVPWDEEEYQRLANPIRVRKTKRKISEALTECEDLALLTTIKEMLGGE